jgi:hypothetical protein
MGYLGMADARGLDGDRPERRGARDTGERPCRGLIPATRSTSWSSAPARAARPSWRASPPPVSAWWRWRPGRAWNPARDFATDEEAQSKLFWMTSDCRRAPIR